MFLKEPAHFRSEDHLIQWQWYLLEKFIEKVSNILLSILSNENQSKEGKQKALILLLKAGYENALQLWSDIFKKRHELPFEHETNALIAFIEKNNNVDTIKVLTDVLDYSYENKIIHVRSYKSIQEYIYDCFIYISTKDKEGYFLIRDNLEILIKKYTGEHFVIRISHFKENLDQKFYESHEYEIPILEAIASFERMTCNL